MKAKHIKSISLITDQSKMWDIMEFSNDNSWAVAFEVSAEFKRTFITHMRSILHSQDIFESGLEEDEFTSREMIEELGTFSYLGAHWFISIEGKYIVRTEEYDDIFEQEVPDDWWMENIGLMKRVMRKLEQEERQEAIKASALTVAA